VDSCGTVYKTDQYPYKETDFLKKCNACDQHKILMERILIESGLKYVILRLGNVYGDKTPEQIIHGVINT
jgi:dTDP-4-dehydrorhamnose reductase